jgi:hypothetical protein
MIHKTWNARDQTREELISKAESLYKEIERSFKLLKKLSNLEDAKKMIDNIWGMKAWANEIQIELLRREYNKYGISEENETEP